MSTSARFHLLYNSRNMLNNYVYSLIQFSIREPTFNLKVGGRRGFGLMGKCFPLSDMDRKKYSESTVYLKKYRFL